MDNENIALRFEMKDDDAKDDMTEVGNILEIFFLIFRRDLLRFGNNYEKRKQKNWK